MWTTRQAAFASARDEFCTSSKSLIEVLDRYGRILDDRAITVGDVRTGAADLKQARTDAGTSADAAIKAHDELAAANEELTAALPRSWTRRAPRIRRAPPARSRRRRKR